MSADRFLYLDSSAIVKLSVREAESTALRRHLRRRQPLVSSALARTETARALLSLGSDALARLDQAMSGIEIIRINDRILRRAASLLPAELRTLDAIHLATALSLGNDLARLCTYDQRMAGAASELGIAVVAPA